MIAEMTHIRLIGLKKSESKIIDRLVERGLFEVRSTDETSFGLGRGEASAFRELKLKQSRVAFAVDFLEKRYAETAAAAEARKKSGEDTFELKKRKFTKMQTAVTRADFEDARAKEYELLTVCDKLQEISFEIIDCRTRAQEPSALVRMYEPYAALPLKFTDLKRTGDVCVAAYAAANPTNPAETLDELRCAYEIAHSDGGALAVVVSRADEAAAADKAMSACGFMRCAFADDCTAADKIAALIAERRDIERQIFELGKKALDYFKYYEVLKILYDVLENEIERAEADERFLKTDSTFILEGWMPTEEVKPTLEKLRADCPDVFVQTLAPEQKDDPPTLAVNKKAIEPYEQITNMSSPPKYRELDPTPVMAVFFFLFFGLMIGDAGYGLVLAAVGIALGASKRFFGKGARMLLLLVGMGGISAVIWGAVFGGYFAVSFSEDISLWFNPLDEPIMFLALAIALGVVQLSVGYAIKFIKLCKDGKPFSAIFDAGSMLLLFGALGCLAAKLMLKSAPSGLTTAAIVLAATGGGLLIIFGGRNAKSIIGKIFGGFKEIYGLINIFSDILSYSRIFGLGLATVAIGMAFNTLGSMLFNIPVVGYPIGIILLVPLHAFNILIGVLGAYVHNARLQFLEFYGKFYDGGGRLFVPFGSRARYTRIERGVADGVEKRKRVKKLTEA